MVVGCLKIYLGVGEDDVFGIFVEGFVFGFGVVGELGVFIVGGEVDGLCGYVG